MGLTPPLDRRPILVALAGPNGAGISTFFHAHVSATGLLFVNADVIAAAAGKDPYGAARVADSIRRFLMDQRESFIFGTVFSDPGGEELRFLKEAESKGYTVVLLFIGIDGPVLSGDRVAMRVLQGGHDVPSAKLTERFPRIMKNLKCALAELPNVWVYDNSDLGNPYRLVAKTETGKGIELHEPVPKWLRPLLPVA